MNEYLFYTSEGSCQAPNGDNIENCQILGEECGQSASEALEKLLLNNPWINGLGYNQAKIIVRELS